MDKGTRRQLIETTSHLLETQGYHGTGLNQIVRESGAPRGSLYYYFPEGKEELAAAAIEEQGEAMRRHTALLLNQTDDPIDAVDRVFAALAEHFSASHFCGGAPVAAVALETAASSERLRGACNGAYAGLAEQFEQKLLDGRYEPEQAKALAITLVALIEGAAILCRTRQSSEPLDVVRREVGALLACRSRQP